MNQRSTSFRQHKASLQTDISFDKKINKAIHQKKHLIANMAHPKYTNQQLMSYRLSPFTRKKQTIKTQQAADHQRSNKIVYISQQMMTQYLGDNNIHEGSCVNHPLKKAAFEQKQQRGHLFCHECAIRMVKNDHKVVGLNKQTLMVKSLLERQLVKIGEEEVRVMKIVEEYYQELRQTFQQVYLEFLDQRSYQPESVVFGEFKVDTGEIQRIKEYLGGISEVRLKFVDNSDKQNKIRNRARASNQSHNYFQKQLHTDMNFDSSHTLEVKSHRDERKPVRSRQNSYHCKGKLPEPRKVLNLR